MKSILIQLDTDSHPSVFDGVVAVDAGVDHLFRYGGVTPENVEALVHGAMFTRGPKNLKSTAIFIGGSDVAAGEAVFQKVGKTFFGPLRVSVLMDSNGSNTTSAAAVMTARRHLDLDGSAALVLGGTGPVGQRVAQLLAFSGAHVRVASRLLERAESVIERIGEAARGNGEMQAVETSSPETMARACEGVQLVIAAGAAGVQFLDEQEWTGIRGLRVAIDLNAVPPVGLAGIDTTDAGTDKHGVICYGAIGVGGAKMRIHRAALQRLFVENTLQLDTQAVFEIAQQLD